MFKKIKKFKKHFKKWNRWRKYNSNSWLYKLAVLLGIRHSPSFLYWYSIEDFRERGYDGKI